MSSNKIILVAGGTAGHVFPACALSVELKKKNAYTCLITDQRGAKHASFADFDKIIILPIKKLNLTMLFLAPYLFTKSLFSILGYKKIIFFGGYTTLFPFIASILLFKIKIIYQLDSIVTRLNKILIPLANYVIFSFPQTKVNNKNQYCLGIPTRNGFEFSFIKKDKELNISIIGGSLGSNYWVNLIKNTLENLPNEILQNINLKIQTTADINWLERFNLKSIECKKFYETSILFAQSHLIIARAGASTIAEIASVGRCSFLVPWEKAMQNHQYFNALNYSSMEGADFGNSNEYLKLASMITNIYSKEDFFYKKCEHAATSFATFAKQNAAKLILKI